MDLSAKEMWQWCLQREIYISAIFCPGIQNKTDFFSRNLSDSTEWMLKKKTYFYGYVNSFLCQKLTCFRLG